MVCAAEFAEWKSPSRRRLRFAISVYGVSREESDDRLATSAERAFYVKLIGTLNVDGQMAFEKMPRNGSFEMSIRAYRSRSSSPDFDGGILFSVFVAAAAVVRHNAFVEVNVVADDAGAPRSS